MKFLATVGALSLVFTSCLKKTPHGASETDGLLSNNCYAPQLDKGVEHDEVQIPWIEKVGQFGVEAEEHFGVPAAGILAISAMESGYGNTRTAKNAYNPFSYKWTGKEMAGGRPYWVLTCQPAGDPNNKYIKFKNYEDAFLYVSERLANASNSWANYKAPTDRYVADRRNGMSVEQAVDRWIDGIAQAGYNYDPKTYSVTLKKAVRNYLKPSWELSDKYSLLAYSESTFPLKGRAGPGSPIASSQQPSKAFNITKPDMNATVSGKVNITLNVPKEITQLTPPRAIAKVTYSIRSENDPVSAAVDVVVTAPYSIPWDTTKLDDGGYIIRIVAYDKDGKGIDEDKRYVLVKNGG